MPSAVRSRPRAPHLGPERRRPQLLDAARGLAIRGGLGTVTIGSVALEAGITRSVVYTAFADRVEMVAALLERELSVVLSSVLTALRSSGGIDDPAESFRAGFRALMSAVDQNPESFRFLIASEPDPAVSSRFTEARTSVTEQATIWIRPAIERWWRTADLEHKLPLLIELFMASCETAVRKYLDDSTGWTAEEVADFVGAATYRIFSLA